MTKANTKTDLAKALKDTQKELSSYMEELAKERASFINYRNRAVKDNQTARFWGKKDAVIELLPVLDDINRAQTHGEIDPKSPFGAIVTKLINNLQKIGLQSYGEAGEPFDHEFHEAIMSRQDSEAKKDKIEAIIEKGYKIDDIVVRPARVSVIVPKTES
ncbi:MAG: nucleotide exchange factor GrpE [Bifidobacteriaceae bacterium]|jgi:molecular chaperone GrpE|nr:nucleotide exchange factor GrpE [Bifidobacteriaceae bacterium]